MENINQTNPITLLQKVQRWVGSWQSLVIHTVIFVGIFALLLIGVPLDTILLILTTSVSLEAIYLAIFIQMGINEQAEDIDDILEDTEDLTNE